MDKRFDTRESVKKAYGSFAAQKQSCCGPKKDFAVSDGDLGLSCGNPVSFGYIKEGDVVVDLGSGAGRDVFLAAEKTGPKGLVIGVDMTDEMLALAAKNAQKFKAKTGLSNIEFRKGYIESLPVEDCGADLVISNCVINLSPDKPAVFKEIYRILKPGSKMVVSDIVLKRELPQAARQDENLYNSCIAGALLKNDYLDAIKSAGFNNIEILAETGYKESVNCSDPITSNIQTELTRVAASITVMAIK